MEEMPRFFKVTGLHNKNVTKWQFGYIILQIMLTDVTFVTRYAVEKCSNPIYFVWRLT